MMHEMMLLMMGQRLFLAPITDNPQQVLDLGTGTGIWALDFGALWIVSVKGKKH